MTAPAQSSARATAAAVATPAPRPAPAPKRPPLRVVQPGETVKTRRRARPRLLVAGGMAIGALVLFALVAAHVLLTQNQFRLQEVQRKAAGEQARYERLRAEVAELESPARIVAAAQQRLGMVPPASVKYLTPAGAVGGEADAPTQPPLAAHKQQKQPQQQQRQQQSGAQATTAKQVQQPAPATASAGDEQATTEWSAVKRQLSGSRP